MSHSDPNKIILVHTNQRGNPLLNYISQVRIQFQSSISVDYQISRDIGILFISLKYYQAYPEYLKARLASIKSGSAGSWRILAVLCLIDALVKHHTTDVCIQQITSLLYKHQVTLILAWRPFDAARYIETFKIYENKAPDPIMESKIKDDPLSQAIAFLTCIPMINSTDAMSLLTYFRSIKNICLATEQELLAVPRLGPTKVRHIIQAFEHILNKEMSI